MTTFSDLNLNPKVLKAVSEAGYDTPTPIQAGAIPPALEGKDVLGIAQTGTGKTASFTLPLITALARGRARARMPRSLVLCPTRELAAQVAENFDIYAKHVKLTKALLIGGVSFKEQDALIDKGVDVLIATPGRLLDHFERGKLILNDVKIMVVDEADRMLDMGFIPDIERIFGLVPFTRQTLFFSATMAPEIERITNTFLSAPAKVEVARQSTTSDTIEQRLISFKPTRRDLAAKQKREMLREAITAEGDSCTNAIIFCNRKVDVDILAKSLQKHGLNAEPIHGDLDQSHRTRTLDGFRDGSIKYLIASDVAARGLDIPNVSHVINYDLPGHAEDYVHRIGRTGRAGRKGVAISLAVPSDDKLLAAIEALIGNPIPPVDAPWTPEAPRPRGELPEESEDKPKRSRSRSRKKAPEADPAVEAPTTEAQDDTPQPRARSKGRSRGKGRSDDRIVGMGDHLPSFIALSFDERRGRKAEDTASDDDTSTDASDTEAETAA
jgi:superfamily II DNA/RNA helicase